MSGARFSKASNQSMPPDCQALVITFVADLTILTTFELDLTNQVLQGHVDLLQAVYIDNSANGSPMTITCQGNGYSVTKKAHTQGWHPMLIIPGQEVFEISTTGGVRIPLQFINVPMPVGSWDTV